MRAMQKAMRLGRLNLAGAGPALAHPHVWIDIQVEVILNARNEATGVRIGWPHDDLYSLFVIGDMGVDHDWDGVPTPEETGRLAGLALASGLAQAGVAVALVYALVAALGLARGAVEGVAQDWLTPAGHAMVAGLGLWLIWRGARRLVGPWPWPWPRPPSRPPSRPPPRRCRLRQLRPCAWPDAGGGRQG
jgi:hypothetical protein